MAGILYLVATPIGNLGDFSTRAIETLREVDFIAAEDTRVTMKLLNHFDIKKPLVSYYEHNKAVSGGKILDRMIAGESCALVTDAGMPAISDPGEDIVRLCADSGITVTAVPGASAVPTALALSGLPTRRFTFEGFLPVENGPRREHLSSLIEERRTMVFYEAPHRLVRTLGDMLEAFGEDRKISLCRELTKLHEEIIRTTIGEAYKRYSDSSPRGEFVLVVAGAEERKENMMELPEAVEEVLSLCENGMKLGDAAREISKKSGISRSVLYNEAVSRR